MNKAELIAEIGNLINDATLSLATRNKLLAKSDDAAIPAAIASRNVDTIATTLNISPAEAEALLSKLAARLAARKGNQAGNAAASKANNLARGMGQNQQGSVGFADNAAGTGKTAKNATSQSAKDAKKLGNSKADDLAREKGFKNAHDLKKQNLKGQRDTTMSHYNMYYNSKTKELFLKHESTGKFIKVD